MQDNIPTRPKQRLKKAEKTEEYAKNAALFYSLSLNQNRMNISRTSDVDLLSKTTNREDIENLVEGFINDKKYDYVVNPLENDLYSDFPAKLRNFNIITPIFNQLLGAYSKRVIEPVVFALNSTHQSDIQQKEFELILKNVQQAFVNAAITAGTYVEGQKDEQGQELPPPQSMEVIKKELSSVRDIKAINGQSSLDFIFYKQDVVRKFRELVYNFLVLGECYTYKTVQNDEVVYKRVVPENFFFEHSPHIDYVEDSAAVKYVTTYNYNELYDALGDKDGFAEIEEELQKLADSETSSERSFMSVFNNNFNKNNSIKASDTNYGFQNNRFIVSHVQWTALRLTYRIFSNDENGKEVFYDVDDDHIFDEGQKGIPKWINEKWEAFVINNSFVVGAQELSLQRASFDNPTKCKNSYNGRIYKQHVKNIKLLAEHLEPYQESYNILKFKIAALVAKNKDKLLILPIGLFNHLRGTKEEIGLDGDIQTIPDDSESVIETALYHAEKSSVLFVDESEQNAQIACNMIKSVDLSLGNYIEYLYNYAEKIKAEAEEQIGFNRFVKANTNTNDAVSNVNQGNYVGSLITEEIFLEFNEFIEKECSGFIDLAKYAYRMGKAAKFMKDEITNVILNLEEGALTDTDFGLFVKNGGKVKANFELLQQRTLEFAQNGMKQSVIAKIISSSSNYSSLIEEIENMEKEMQEEQQRQAEVQQAQADAALQSAQAIAAAQQELERYKIDSVNANAIELAYIAEEGALLRQPSGDNGTAALIKLEELKEKQLLRMSNEMIKREEMRSKELIKDKDVSIAKINK